MYQKKNYKLMKHFDFVILDMICLQLAFVAACFIFGNEKIHNPYSIEIYRNLAVLIEVISFVVFLMNDSLKNVLKRGYYLEFLNTVKHALYTLVICVFLLFLIKSAQQYSRLVFGFTFLIYTFLTYIARLIRKKVVQGKKKTEGERRLLIVANVANAEKVIEEIQENNYKRYKLSGLVLLDAEMVGETISGVPVVAAVEDAPMYVCHEWVDEVLLIPQDFMKYPEKLVDQLMLTGVTVHVNLAKIENSFGNKQLIEKVAGYTVLTNTMNDADPVQLLLKRLMDIAGGLVGCVLTLILFVIIAPIIYVNSPGPIFFVQERVGRNGKKFKMYKFRSMYMDAEERKAELMSQNKIRDGKMFKMDFDPRVIGNKILPDGTRKKGIGQFIRDTSIDEFPQFFSVVRGTMSIVGTRPPIPGEVNLYELHHKSRLAIKPGITGMWQISGRSSIIDFDEVVKLDQEYIRNWTLSLDIKILLKTIFVVFRKDGSM